MFDNRRVVCYIFLYANNSAAHQEAEKKNRDSLKKSGDGVWI